MIQRILFFIGALMMVSACAPTQKPKFQFPTDTRIGIINHLENYVTHQNFSSLRFGNFSKEINVDWNLPTYMEDKLTRLLRADSRYTIVPMEPGVSSGRHSAIIDEVSMADEIKPEVADYFEALADKHDLDVVIIIKSYRGPSAVKLGKHPFQLKGYGLFTKVFLLSKQAYAYANTAVIVFKAKPLTYICSGKPQNKKSPLSNFDLSGDLKNIPQSEINKLQPIIQKYADQAVANALNDANLIF